LALKTVDANSLSESEELYGSQPRAARAETSGVSAENRDVIAKFTVLAAQR